MIQEFWQGDCLELMQKIPDYSIDMILTDLPYGKTSRTTWDIVIPIDKLWEQWKRVVKDRAAIVLTATEPFTSQLVMSNLKWFRYDLIWHKNNAKGHLNAKRQPLRAHEQVLVFGKKSPNYYPQKTTGHVPVNQYKRKMNAGTVYGATSEEKIQCGGQTDRYPRSVLEFAVVPNGVRKRIHVSQKPVDLFEWLIKSYTKPLDIVLDCCAGSGTTAVAAKLQGRQYVMIEKDEEIFHQAQHRLTGMLW